MRACLRNLAFLASFAALIVIGGGHWAVLQTVAWTQMIVDYTRDSGSLRQGVTQTFDGAHPCKLCRQINAGIQKEKRDDRQQTRQNERAGKISLNAVLPTEFSAPFSSHGERLAPLELSFAGRLADAPPVPPPRRGLTDLSRAR